MTSEIRGLVSRSLHCLAEFENLVSELYYRLSESSTDKIARLSLSWISAESKQHSKYLSELASTLNLERDASNCAEFIGVPWTTVENLFKDIGNTRSLSSKEVADTLKKLNIVENFAAEEVYSNVLIKQIRDVAALAGISIKVAEIIFSEIAEEERYHNELVSALIKMLKKDFT
ncbi:MAG: hypothetical protein RMI56_04975 [Sulfolobales archaeon]|nr:hypothetical protein [Sulfolobales archaeon]MDW8083135.1 hypothetical protein [Sulfolobales archaeon]